MLGSQFRENNERPSLIMSATPGFRFADKPIMAFFETNFVESAQIIGLTDDYQFRERAVSFLSSRRDLYREFNVVRRYIYVYFVIFNSRASVEPTVWLISATGGPLKHSLPSVRCLIDFEICVRAFYVKC